jgi:hypothetical protein
MITLLAIASSLALLPADSVLRRGKPVPSGPAVTVAQVLAEPGKYDSTVVIEGVVVRSCTKMGCWMQLADAPDAKGIRVSFHDGSFVIPVGAAGMRARTIGKVKVKVLKEDEVAHLEGEGAAIERNAKGEALEVGVGAVGVELFYN